MKALWQIILAFLWRLRPVQALEVNLRDIIELGLAMFADDQELERLSADPAYRAKIAAAMADAHRKLDLLVYLRACELTGVTKRLGFKPNYSHTHASTDLVALWRSFERLIAKFDDYERYAAKRAERLTREQADYPMRLAATLQAISPALCALAATGQRLASLSASRIENGMARRSAAKAAGGCVLARGPPLSNSIADCRLPRRLHLRERPLTPQPIRTRSPRVCTPKRGGRPCGSYWHASQL